MAKVKTYTTLVVDRSGSMQKVREEAEGGIRGFIEKLNELPDSQPLVSLYEFDSTFDKVYGPVKATDALEYSLEPRGWTALFDAVGMAIEDTRQNISQLSEKDRPEKVAIVVMTDGEENASKEYTFESVKKLVSERQSEGWEIIFLAGTMEAQQFAQASGIRSTTFNPSQHGQTQSVYAAASNATMDWYQGNTRGIETPDTVDSSGTVPSNKDKPGNSSGTTRGSHRSR